MLLAVVCITFLEEKEQQTWQIIQSTVVPSIAQCYPIKELDKKKYNGME